MMVWERESSSEMLQNSWACHTQPFKIQIPFISSILHGKMGTKLLTEEQNHHQCHGGHGVAVTAMTPES